MVTPVGVYGMAERSIIAPVDDSVMLYCDWLITLAGDWTILEHGVFITEWLCVRRMLALWAVQGGARLS